MVSYHLIPQNLAVPQLGTVLRDEETVKWFEDLEQFRLIFLNSLFEIHFNHLHALPSFFVSFFLLLAAFVLLPYPAIRDHKQTKMVMR